MTLTPPLSAGDWEADMCSGASSLGGLATVYDYERFFWDLGDKDGMNVEQIVGVMSDANAGTPWNSGWGNNSSDVQPRLTAAAGSTYSFWFTEAVANGVYR